MKVILVEKAMNLSVIPEEIRSQRNFAIQVNFFIGGIINVYQQYLIGTLDATDEEIIEENGVPEDFGETLRQIAEQTRAAKEYPVAGLALMPILHTVARGLPVWMQMMAAVVSAYAGME